MQAVATMEAFAGPELVPEAFRRAWTAFVRLISVSSDQASERDEQISASIESDLELVKNTLRFGLWAAGLAEGLLEVGVTALPAAPGQPVPWDRVRDLARALTGIDLISELDENAVLADIIQRADPPAPNSTTKLSTETLLTTTTAWCRTILTSVPESLFLRRLGFERTIHEIESAVEGIRCLLLRHSSETHRLLLVLGRSYAAGKLDLADLEEALNLRREDVLVALEQHGFSRRPASALRAEPELEERVLQRLRQGRRANAPRRIADASRVRRDVVATQRIEGVDARWLPTPTKPLG